MAHFNMIWFDFIGSDVYVFEGNDITKTQREYKKGLYYVNYNNKEYLFKP